VTVIIDDNECVAIIKKLNIHILIKKKKDIMFQRYDNDIIKKYIKIISGLMLVWRI